MTIFFTSDTHFGHANIIRYANRPFADVREMNEALIENWNSTVGPHDTVYFLGDFALAKPASAAAILERLNGEIHLVPGNHDKKHIRKLSRWASVEALKEITIDGTPVTLCHYAMQVWNRWHHGAIHLFGHSHGKIPPSAQRLDVGVDCWNFRPASWEEIRRRLAEIGAKENA